jgi:hypothetical protein
MQKPAPSDAEWHSLVASVQCLGQRMDCFYSWAAQLQTDIRELKKALPRGPVVDPGEEALRARLSAVTANR